MVAVASPEAVETRQPRPWVGHLLTFVGWLVGSYLVSMLLWVLLPMILLGWKPLVVVSDSMAPLIRAGDVVLVDSPRDTVETGTIIAFEADSEVMLHRVVAVEETGYVTKGDANPNPDSTVVLHESVMGQGRLLVPYLGLARVMGWGWWLALGVLAAAAIPAWRARTGLGVGVGIGLLAITGLATAWAVFSDDTANAGSSVVAATVSPATNLTASCGLIGVGNVDVHLNWSTSPTPGVTGYRVLHDAPGGGTNFTQVGTVGSTQTSFTHVVSVALLGLGTHTYAIQAIHGPWESTLSNTDSVSITQALIYVCN